MPPRKRPAESVDLTSSDGPVRYVTSLPSSQTSTMPRAPKQPRVSAPNVHAPRAVAGSSQANPYTIDDDDEDAGAEEVQDASQSFNEAESRFSLYGVLSTKIVGCRYYSGVATAGEITILRREPHNQ
jgi:SWI/SNF-related matrix-associated actin-dependent regulator of chromatin subfamily A3